MVLLKLQGPGESFVLICFVVGWPHRPCKTKWLAGWSSRLKSTTLTALCIGTTSDLYSFTSTSTRKERCAINGNINTEQTTYRPAQIMCTHIYAPVWRSSRHSNVISNWKGLKNAVGLSKTVTFVTCTLAILPYYTILRLAGNSAKVLIIALRMLRFHCVNHT